jgi:putative transcriptional regulator
MLIVAETLRDRAMSKKKPLSAAERVAFEANQDFEALLVQSAREMGAGKTRKVYTPVVAAKTLIAIAEKMPEALRAVGLDYKAPRRVAGRAKAKQIKV